MSYAATVHLQGSSVPLRCFYSVRGAELFCEVFATFYPVALVLTTL